MDRRARGRPTCCGLLRLRISRRLQRDQDTSRAWLRCALHPRRYLRLVRDWRIPCAAARCRLAYGSAVSRYHIAAHRIGPARTLVTEAVEDRRRIHYGGHEASSDPILRVEARRAVDVRGGGRCHARGGEPRTGPRAAPALAADLDRRSRAPVIRRDPCRELGATGPSCRRPGPGPRTREGASRA